MSKIKDISGNVYGLWTVISYHGKKKWLCRCACGAEKPIQRGQLTIGGTLSCGCRQYKHGEGYSKTKEFNTWAGIKGRCYNPNNGKYPIYGGRGIIVCDRWKDSYINFLSDMGRAPSPSHSIERNDVNGNYEPNNCRWATAQEQADNKTTSIVIEYKGERMNLKQWSKRLGLGYRGLHRRITNPNFTTIAQAFETPFRQRRKALPR